MRLSTALAGLVIAGFVAAGPLPARAQDQDRDRDRRARANDQVSVSTTDIQRLQDTIYNVSGDISRVRQQDPQSADQMQGQLDNLREEATYLKVKLRREGTVSRSEYSDVRQQLDSLRAQVDDALAGRGYTGTTGSQPPYPPYAQQPPYNDQPPYNAPPYTQSTYPEHRQPTSNNPNEVPAGTELDVKLQQPLSSSTAQVEDRFEATTVVDLTNGNGRVLIPAGSVVRGVVTSVNKATRFDRKGSLTLAFDQVRVRGRSYPIHATVTQALESEGIRGEATKIGTGAGVGAILGGILGGVKGALAGILIGGGGTVLATNGKDVALQSGTVLRVTFDSPVVVR